MCTPPYTVSKRRADIWWLFDDEAIISCLTCCSKWLLIDQNLVWNQKKRPLSKTMNPNFFMTKTFYENYALSLTSAADQFWWEPKACHPFTLLPTASSAGCYDKSQPHWHQCKHLSLTSILASWSWTRNMCFWFGGCSSVFINPTWHSFFELVQDFSPPHLVLPCHVKCRQEITHDHTLENAIVSWIKMISGRSIVFWPNRKLWN